MPDIVLTFTENINISAQIGDTAYYCLPSNLGGFSQSTETENNDNIIKIGIIKDISGKVITCNAEAVLPDTAPTAGESFILFSKDNAVNVSSPIGYYAKAKFKNNSKVKSEMFATAVDVFESSK